MVIFILILILLAILYSSERGRGLLEGIFLLPFRIIEYPFRLVKENGVKNKIEDELAVIEKFKKSLGKDDLDLIQEKFILGVYFEDIREQIGLYKKFKSGEISKVYLKPDILETAYGNTSLYIIKSEKIEELRKQ